MKKIHSLFALIVVAVILAGCNRSPTNAYPGTETNSMTTTTNYNTGPTNTWQSTKEAASNVWQNTKEGATNAWNATKEGATTAWQNTKDTAANAWQKTKDAVSETMATNQISTNFFAYDYGQKEAFVAQAKASLNEFDQQMSSLNDRVSSASDSAKADVQQTLQDIRNKRSELDQKYNDVMNASQENWNDAKAAFSKTYADLTGNLKAAWDSLASKM